MIQVFVYPNAWNDRSLWASALALVLTLGPGVFSLDHWIARAWIGRGRHPATPSTAM